MAENAILTISRGMRAPEIAAALEQKGIISDKRVFLAAAYLTQNFKRMKAGEYQFARQTSMANVMSAIVSGREYLYKVTLPEGWTTAQLVERLNSRAELAGTISEDLPEGGLLPATYGFRRGAERQAVINAMREAQDKLLAELWQARLRSALGNQGTGADLGLDRRKGNGRAGRASARCCCIPESAQEADAATIGSDNCLRHNSREEKARPADPARTSKPRAPTTPTRYRACPRLPSPTRVGMPSWRCSIRSIPASSILWPTEPGARFCQVTRRAQSQRPKVAYYRKSRKR